MRVLPLAAVPLALVLAVTAASARSYRVPEGIPSHGVCADSSSSGPLGLMKAKEKGNRTKCGNNLGEIKRTGSSSSFSSIPGWIGRMKAKEKCNRTKCAHNLRTRHDTVKNSINNVR
jgi:hypothetical protein